VLVALLLHANEEVRTTQLLELVWSDVPSSARSNLRTYLTRLRRILRIPGEPESRLQTRRGGHLVTVRPGELDVVTFTDLATKGEQAADALTASRYFERALNTWRGRALENVALGPLLEAEATQLEARREHVYEQYLQTRLALGQHAELLPELRAQLLRNPLWERLAGMLMVALDRSGQRIEALNVFRRTRERLVEELGVEPGAELRELHQCLLSGRDPGTAAGSLAVAIAPIEPATATVTDAIEPYQQAPKPTTRSDGRPARRVNRLRHRSVTADQTRLTLFRGRSADQPAQLPIDLPTFTGRDVELAGLIDGRLPDNRSIIAIDGMPGVGKTALAVHAAHLLAPRFPDGQLFLDLHGYTPGVRPLEPHEALDRMLRSLGVATHQLRDTEVRASLYRSLLAHRKMVIVLDNALSEAQISPLLPGAGASRTLITSRRRLTELHQAYPLSLDTLPLAEAVALFTRICTPQRLANQPPALAEEIVELCGRLPLAVRIAAVRLRNHRFWTLAELRDRLRDEQRQLTELHSGEHDVAMTFNLSLADLDPAEQRVIAMLGLYPGTAVELNAAAALAGLDVTTTERLLERLVDAHLLRQTAPARYKMHNLMRTFMIQRAHAEHPDDVHGAIRRLLDYYLHTADAADQLLQPTAIRVRLCAAQPAVEPLTFANADAALAWCDQLRQDLPYLIRAAEKYDLLEHVWQLVVRMSGYLDSRRRWRDGIAAYEIALRTARRQANRAVECELLMGLAFGAAQLEWYEQAITYYTAAFAVCREIGNDYAEGFSALGLAMIYDRMRHYDHAIEHHHHALEVCRRLDDASAAGVVLGHLGDTYRHMGQLDDAIECYRQACRYSERAGDDYGAGRQLVNISRTNSNAGRYDEAISAARRALAIYSQADESNGEPAALAAPDVAGSGAKAQAHLYLTQAQRMMTTVNDDRPDGWRTYLALLDADRQLPSEADPNMR
jgi:DNA-binding SARP family transcriptional activator